MGMGPEKARVESRDNVLTAPTLEAPTPQNASVPFQLPATTQQRRGCPTVRNARQRHRNPGLQDRLPGRLTAKQPRASHANPPVSYQALESVDEAELDSDDEANAPMHPTHDISHALTFPARPTRSGLVRDRGRGVGS